MTRNLGLARSTTEFHLRHGLLHLPLWNLPPPQRLVLPHMIGARDEETNCKGGKGTSMSVHPCPRATGRVALPRWSVTNMQLILRPLDTTASGSADLFYLHLSSWSSHCLDFEGNRKFFDRQDDESCRGQPRCCRQSQTTSSHWSVGTDGPGEE